MIKQEPMDDYLSNLAISASDIKPFLNKSPFHFKHRKELPKKESSSLSIGTAVHYAILEPELYETKKSIEPQLRRNTNAYKDWLKDQATDAIIVPSDFDEMVERIMESLKRSGLTSLFASGQPEVSAYATLQKRSLDLRCRCDWLNTDKKIIVDLKTTRDLRYFPYDAKKFGYHLSVPHYTNIIAQETQTHAGDWTYIFLAVETEAPYDCNWYVLSQENLKDAEHTWDSCLLNIQSCIELDAWPGFCQDNPQEI